LVRQVDTGGVLVLFGDGTGAFPGELALTPSSAVNFAIAADLDEDGHLDLAVANDDFYGDFVTVHLGDGTGGFGLPTSVPMREARSLTVADLDGDGHVDLASAGLQWNAVYVTYGDGTGGFEGLQILQVGAGPVAVAAADLDGDGRTDLVSANSESDTASILLNLGPPSRDLWTRAGRGSKGRR
jgi:hypothetical protein